MSKYLELYVFDVGHGDCFMLNYNNSECGIIDCYKGPVEDGFLLLKTLDELGIKTIRFLCITHPDIDHMDGVSRLLEHIIDRKIDVHEIWLYGGFELQRLDTYMAEQAIDAESKLHRVLNGNEVITKYEVIQKKRRHKEFKGLMKYVDFRYEQKRKRKIGFRFVELKGVNPISSYFWGAEFHSLAPSDATIYNYLRPERLFSNIFSSKDMISDRNLISSVLLIKYGESIMVIPGDTGKDTWVESQAEFERKKNEYAKYVDGIGANFFKLPHHGSRHSVDENILRYVLDKDNSICVISAGGTVNHPHFDTLSVLYNVKHDSGYNLRLYNTHMTKFCRENVFEKSTEVIDQTDRFLNSAHGVEYNVRHKRDKRCYGNMVFRMHENGEIECVSHQGTFPTCRFLEMEKSKLALLTK